MISLSGKLSKYWLLIFGSWLWAFGFLEFGA
jgi:hypothetical protein